MKIYNTEISKNEVMKRIGDLTQLGGIKYYKFIDGVGKGVRAVDIKSPCGLDMTVLPDRGMDISYLSYKSIPISWKSATKETSQFYYDSSENEWLRSFYGGLITTCGLMNIGLPNVDNGEKLGMHGRIANISAENVYADGKWENDTYTMWVQGKVREAKVGGEKLQLERKITTWMDNPRIVVDDIVENIGHKKSPIMILYHVNIGYPVVGNGSKLIEGRAEVTAWEENAKKGVENFNIFSDPIKGFKSEVYFHDIEADDDGNSNIAIINENFNGGQGIGIWMKFNKDNLPYMIQWKQMGEGEYLCGIEPANSFISGRKVEREKGTLKFIEPGEKIKYRLEFNILKSNKDLEDFKNRFCK